VNAVFVVVDSELFQLPLQVDRVPDHHVIKKLSSYRPDQPFHEWMGHGYVRNRLDLLDIEYAQVGERGGSENLCPSRMSLRLIEPSAAILDRTDVKLAHLLHGRRCGGSRMFQIGRPNIKGPPKSWSSWDTFWPYLVFGVGGIATLAWSGFLVVQLFEAIKFVVSVLR
jgi:hypothetical protein